MRNEDIDGRLQNIEANMQAILLRLKWIEDELHPKKETVFIPPTPAEPTVAAAIPDPSVHAGPPPVIADLPVSNIPEYKWQTEATDHPPVQRSSTESPEPVVGHEWERNKPKIPEFMRENMSATAAAASAPPPPSSTASQFTLPPPPSADDIEYKFGINGLLRGGAVVFVLALLFLVAIMVGRGAITPPVQFAGEIALCLTFVGIGLIKRNEREDFGQLMVGIGSFGLYASFAGGYAYKHLYEGEPLVAMYMLLSLANLGFAFWRSSKSFLTIGMLGGLVAAMMPMHKDKAMLDFALHFLILVPCAAIIVRNKWNGMAGLMWVVSTLALIPATTSHYDQFWRVGATYLNCGIALYACGKVFQPSEFDRHAAIQTVMLVLTGFFAIAIDTGHKGSLHALVLTAIAAGVGYALQENEKARNSTWLGGLIVFAIITPIGFTQNIAAFCYGLEALILIALANRFKLVALWAVSLATFVFSCVAYLYFPDKNILSLARFSAPLELVLLAILSATVGLNIRYALPNKSKDIQDSAIFVGIGLLVAFFVRGMNVVLGNGNTSLHIGAINTLALGLASVAALVIAVRTSRWSVFVMGALTAVTSFLFYMVAAPDGSLSFIRVSAPLDLCLLAIFSTAVAFSVRFLLRQNSRQAQEAGLFVGSGLFVAFFVRAMNIVLGSGHTALNVSAITSISAAIASVVVLVIANRYPRWSLYALGSLTIPWSVAYYLVALTDATLTFIRLVPSLELFLLTVFAVAVSLNIRFVLRNANKNAQELTLFMGGSLLIALFIRGINIVLGNGNTTLHVEDINSLGIGLAGLAMTLVGVLTKRKGLLIASAILTAWVGIMALLFEPEIAPHWLSPALIFLSAACVMVGTKYISDSEDDSYQEPLMVFAGVAMSAFFVRLMHLVGINHLLDLTKETATYFSFGLLNVIWIAFYVRNRRPANLILGWTSFVLAAGSGASLPRNTLPAWLSPVLLMIPIVALGFLYTMTPRKESDEAAVTALCVIPGWFLSTMFLRHESMRPWIGLNNVASYTAAWVIFAVFLITVGFKISRRFLRYWALVVFAATVAKVFMVDLSELDSVIRVAMLTLLGLGMMGGGYWYIVWRRAQTAKQIGEEPQL